MRALTRLSYLALVAYTVSGQRYTSGSSQAPFNAPVKHGPAITPEFSAYADALRRQHDVPGLTIGVVHLKGDDVDTEFGSWGVGTEDGDPASPDTLFQIGSCSKAFLAAAMGILMDDFAQDKNVTALPYTVQSFTWETKIQELFPGDAVWKLSDPWATAKATIRDALSHVSGLPRHDFSYKRTDTPLDVVKRLRQMKPTFELRQQLQYNNQMFILGSHIIATYSGMPFTSFVKERIFEPLGMNSTTYFVDEAIRGGNMSHAFAAGHRRIPYRLADRGTAELISGAGAVISSAVDMSKWVGMLLNKGVNPYTKLSVVPREAIDAVTRVYSIWGAQSATPDTSIVGYGMAWLRYSYRGHEIIAHGGALPGFVSTTAFLPWDNFGIVIMNNRLNGPVPQLLMDRVVQNVLGLPPSPQASTHPSFPVPGIVGSGIVGSGIVGAGIVGAGIIGAGLAGVAGGFLPSASTARVINSGPIEPSLPLNAYEGTYVNPAYGAFTLCSPLSTSSYCWRVLDTFEAVISNNATHGLYAEWPTVWTEHLRFTPRSGHRFGVDAVSVHPRGYGKNKTPFIESEAFVNLTVLAEFIVDGGSEGNETVKGLVLPGGFELPERFVGLGSPLENLQIVFEKIP